MNVKNEKKKKENEHMKNEKINDEIENKYNKMYKNKNNKIDDYKFKTFIYFNFKKIKISEVNKRINKKIDHGFAGG